MIADWGTLATALKNSIVSALGWTSAEAVHIGAPQKPIASFPHAVIQSGPVQRTFEGPRIIREDYEFEIMIRQAKPSEGSTCETAGWATLKTLGDALTPPVTLPAASPSRYASVGIRPFITMLEVDDADPEKGYYDCRLTFTCFCYCAE